MKRAYLTAAVLAAAVVAASLPAGSQSTPAVGPGVGGCAGTPQDRRAGPRQAARPVQAGPDAVQRLGPDRARAPDDRSARDRVPLSREHVLAAERSRRARALQGARARGHAARAQRPALPADQRQPLGSGGREQAVRRRDADASGARVVSQGPEAPGDRSVRRRTPGQEGEHLQPVHDGDAPGRRARQPGIPRRVQAVRQRRGDGTAPGGHAVGRSGVRRLPAAARRRALHRRLLRERHRLGGSPEPEVRRDLRAV